MCQEEIHIRNHSYNFQTSRIGINVPGRRGSLLFMQYDNNLYLQLKARLFVNSRPSKTANKMFGKRIGIIKHASSCNLFQKS